MAGNINSVINYDLLNLSIEIKATAIFRARPQRKALIQSLLRSKAECDPCILLTTQQRTELLDCFLLHGRLHTQPRRCTFLFYSN
jgi:hypothetical protein